MSLTIHVKYLIIFFLFSGFVFTESFSQSASDLPDGVVIIATGTGQTTGHIANLNIQNNTNKDVKTEIGPFYIPSDGRYQSYIMPVKIPVFIASRETNVIPIMGYCTDIRKPPVPDGGGMPPIKKWIVPDIITEQWEPSPNDGWIPKPTVSPDISVAEGFTRPSTIPGTGTILGNTIDQHTYPVEAAPILLEAIIRITGVYDSLKNNNIINTPFSANPEKEREAVIQQTFWIFCAGMGDEEYTKDQFRNKTIQQYETQSGQSLNKVPAPVAEKIDAGIDDFWNTFNLVGVEAKVLSRESSSNLPHLNDLERRLGNDISNVKGHKDSIPSDPLGAKAYATGDKVVPGSDPSKETIAHEPSHVVQQKKGIEVNKQQITNNKNNKPPCGCTSLKGNLKTNLGLREDVSISPDMNKVSPEQKIHYPRVKFDKPQNENEPKEFSVSISDLKLDCDCTAGPCEMLAAEKDKYDKAEKYSIAVTSMSSGVKVDGSSKVGSTGSHTFDFTSKIKSDDIRIKFTISSHCKSDNCLPKRCKSTIVLVFKEEEVKKEKK